ncbi:SDR family oxidoreductase [Salinibacterium sp. NG22]|uniref:SDR family NAD(P)-dependent oxidoreductase n=1 Tax=Salinibacterium sp. NG22 TaxID=2792040 RepID=UPI0018CDB7B8|nr:SDR family oxidoreductase [Salinibacterium sp. NG22]MBH0111117.1 SDR family oxidoreductase [Salinibacterium sp. NG22]
MAISYTGTTVLVTGASSGLGEEFARQLAARGADLVLVARRIDRLEQLATELRASHGVNVTPIERDLSTPDAASTLAAELTERGIPVHSLVNNAGFATRNRFEDEEPARIDQEIALNVGALVALTRQFYPQLRSHDAGVLINVASTAGYQPVPFMAVYGATKAFVLSFTEALWSEAQGTGLTVLALSPGATRTEFFDVAGAGAQVGNFRTSVGVVALALATVDRRNPPPSVIDGGMNRATTIMTRLASRRLVAAMTRRVTGRGLS